MGDQSGEAALVPRADVQQAQNHDCVLHGVVVSPGDTNIVGTDVAARKTVGRWVGRWVGRCWTTRERQVTCPLAQSRSALVMDATTCP